LSFHPEVPQVVDLREPKNLHSFYLSPFITIMNRTLRSFRVAFLGLLLVLTGCLTIEEQYTFKKDGSGTMTYIVDMSEMGEMMKGLGKMSESLGEKDQEPMMDMDDEAGELKTIPGISKVKVNKKKEWVRSISFRFKDLASLNAALNKLMPDSTNTEHTFFSWDGNTLVRTSNRFASELGAGMAKTEEGKAEGEEGMDMSMLLGTMKYKYAFKFSDAIEATTAADALAKEEVGSKEVKLNTDWATIAKDDKGLDLRIRLNK